MPSTNGRERKTPGKSKGSSRRKEKIGRKSNSRIEKNRANKKKETRRAVAKKKFKRRENGEKPSSMNVKTARARKAIVE